MDGEDETLEEPDSEPEQGSTAEGEESPGLSVGLANALADLQWRKPARNMYRLPALNPDGFPAFRNALSAGLTTQDTHSIQKSISAFVQASMGFSDIATEALKRVQEQLKDASYLTAGISARIEELRMASKRPVFAPDGIDSSLGIRSLFITSEEVRAGLERAIGPTLLDESFKESLQSITQAVSDFSKLSLPSELSASSGVAAWSRFLDSYSGLPAIREALTQIDVGAIAREHPALATVMEVAGSETAVVEAGDYEASRLVQSIESTTSDRWEARLMFLFSVLLALALWANPREDPVPSTQVVPDVPDSSLLEPQVDLDAHLIDWLQRLADISYVVEERQLLHDAPLRIQPTGKANEQCRLDGDSIVSVVGEKGQWYEVVAQPVKDGEPPVTGWLNRRHLKQ